jgi:hypothetical protein
MNEKRVGAHSPTGRFVPDGDNQTSEAVHELKRTLSEALDSQNQQEHELMQFINRLVEAGALQWRWDHKSQPIRCWRVTAADQRYVDLAAEINDGTSAAVAYLFAQGKVEFAVRRERTIKFIWRMISTSVQ